METKEPAIDKAAMRSHGVSGEIASTIDARFVPESVSTALVGGLAAAAVAAGAWAALTVLAGCKIGAAAVAAGFLVGHVVRFCGKGHRPACSAIGAGCTVLACVMGNLLCACALISVSNAASALDVTPHVLSQPHKVAELIWHTTYPADLVFYGVAVCKGAGLAVRPDDAN